MKQIIFIVFIFINILNSREYIVHGYMIEIDVNSTKPNGFSWDFSGGSPDIFIKVDGRKVAFSSKCKNQYRCQIEFVSEEKKNWYFEIYDKDFSSDDLIGKGECPLNKECVLGSSKILIKE